jgi:hypothetical protein
MSAFFTRYPEEGIRESWRSHMSGKDALQIIPTNSLWTVEMNFQEDSPVFSLGIGFVRKDDPKWKSFRNVIVLGIIVVHDAILVDVVNSSNNTLGLIPIRVEDKMTFCSNQMMINYDAVPPVYQSLLRDSKGACDACGGHFVKTAQAVTKYLSNATSLHARRLTIANSAEAKQKRMEGDRHVPKKKKTGESSSGAANRARPPPLSALAGAAPIVHPEPQPTSSAHTAANVPDAEPATRGPPTGRVGPPARPKMKSKKRKARSGDAAGQSPEAPSEADRWQRVRRTSSPACDSDGVRDSEGVPQAEDVPEPSATQDEANPGRVSEEEAQKLAYKKVNGRWVDNPEVVPLVPEDVPEKLFVDVVFKNDISRSADANARIRLKAEALANKKYRELSKYMYIFGQGTYFELDVADMVNADEKTGVIFRPLEKAGILYVLEQMVKLNFNKQILTVMPATKTRPTCWEECVAAGPFIIIDGQHTWSAAKEIITGETAVDDPKVIESMRKWTCEVVWSESSDHLHSLSCKRNDGNVNGPFLSSLCATIQHCRYLWDNARRPSAFRKNPKKKDQNDEFRRYEVRLVTS